MNDRLWFLLMVVIAFGIYRQAHVVWFFFKRRQARRQRYRGIRLVITKPRRG